MFQCSNCNIILFFHDVKNKFEILHVFINAYNLHYILLYISIDFFYSQLYILLTVKKHVNNIYILIHLRVNNIYILIHLRFKKIIQHAARFVE